MLPSKEKFHFYVCPYYVNGNCDRPYCHFKHTETGDGSKEKSPSLSESDTEEKCPPSCLCNKQQNKGVPKIAKSMHQTNLDDTGSTMKVSQPAVPKYRPTPISQLQKRSEDCGENENATMDCDDDDKNTKKHMYSPNGLELPSALLYNPSNILNLNIKVEPDTELSTSYTPSSLSSIGIIKEEYRPSGLNDGNIKEYEPSKINLMHLSEPTYTPVGSSTNDAFNYEPSNKEHIIKQEPEYNPSGGSKNTKQRLEYTPSSNINCTTKGLEYTPLSSVTGSKNLNSDIQNKSSNKDLRDSFNYIPTEKSKLPTVPQFCEVDMFAQEKIKTSSSKHKSSQHKNREKSSESSKQSHKRSHSSSSHRDSKKHKNDSSKNEGKKDETKRSSSKVSSKNKSDKTKGSSSDKSHSKSSTSSSKSSRHSRKDDKNHKHSSSRSTRDKEKEKSKSNHHSSNKKSSHKDKKDKHQSSHKHDSSKKTSDVNGNKEEPKKSLMHDVDLVQVDSQDYSDFEQEDSQDDVLQECFRIFEEFEFEGIVNKNQETSSSQSVSPEKQNKVEIGEEMTVAEAAAKRRIAHEAASRKVVPPKNNRIRPVSASAGQMLAERWRKQQEIQVKAKSEKEAAGTSNVSDLLSQLMDDTTPKPAMPWLKKNAPSSSTQANKDEERTVAQSFGKGKTRVAHKAKEELLQRPIVSAAPGDKISCSRRQHALDKFADSCLNIFPNSKEAFEKAVELEIICFEKSHTTTVYNNLFVNQMLRLKHATTPAAVLSMNNQTSVAATRVVVSFNQGVMEKHTFSRDYNFAGPELYKRLEKYMLDPNTLKGFGYPFHHESNPQTGSAQIMKIAYPGQTVQQRKDLRTDQRECIRCRQIYRVDKHGMPQELVGLDKCNYHPKRAYKKRVRGGYFELLHECCNREPGSSEGCESHKYHVSENFDLDNLTGFVTTFKKDIPKHNSGVYALDCEMCITTEGTEVTRVTVVNESHTCVYNALIKPDKPVLDYCTEYSGITEEMLKGVTTNLREVQSVLLNLFSRDTILIGHSLNGDLQVLKIIHKTVVDTSIVFPHREGLPKRRALKNVCKDFLNKSIQSGVDGHDSYEDARACMELMLFRVKEDAKLE